MCGCPTPSTSLPATCSSTPTGHTGAAPITSTDVTIAAYDVLAGVLCHRCLSTGLAAVSVTADPANLSGSSEARSAYVAVSVATVWTTPQSPRPVDHSALANPVDIRGWLSDMTPAQQEALTSDNLNHTQALFGDRVFVVGGAGRLGRGTGPRPAHTEGLHGLSRLDSQGPVDDRHWLRRTEGTAAFALADRGITTWLHRESGLSDPDLEISTNTRLPVLSRTDKAVQVATPDRGPKWLDARTVAVYEKPTDIPHPTGADLVQIAAVFVDVPYLWGGRAGFGFDCFGFTSTIYQVYGITLPRDAGPQAADSRGRPVDKSALQPGDLLFYSHGSRDPTIPTRSTTWPCIPGTAT